VSVEYFFFGDFSFVFSFYAFSFFFSLGWYKKKDEDIALKYIK